MWYQSIQLHTVLFQPLWPHQCSIYRTQVAVAPQGFTITILRVVVDSSLMRFINHNPHRERIRVNPELKNRTYMHMYM